MLCCCWLAHLLAHCASTSAPPSIKLLLVEPMVVNPGQTVTLVCVASGGEPPPSLSWVRPAGEELPDQSVVNGGTLTIPAITVEEGGAYTCLASNNVGSPVKKSVSVLVRGTESVCVCVCGRAGRDPFVLACVS